MTTLPENTSLRLRFADFELDEDNAQLTRAGQPIPLPPKAFAVLCALARRGGQLTKKDALLDAVWGHRHVSESVLKTTISQVRAALTDDAAQPRYIETVARLGYRFIGATETAKTRIAVVQFEENSPWFPAAPMIGRRDVIERLHLAWNHARISQKQLVWIAGDAGIGKTTLIENFLDTVPDAVIARGQCVEQYGSGEPYLPMLEMLGSLCRRYDELPELMRIVAPTWLVQFPWLLNQAERGVLQRELMGTHPDRMLRELAELLERFSQQRPLIFAIEDLHWSDGGTLRLIDHFARRPSTARLLWLCSFRLTQIQMENHPLLALRRELRLHKLCEEILLDAFSETEIAAYLESRAADIADAALIKRLHEHTGGLPLFIANVVDTLIQEGRIQEGQIQEGGAGKFDSNAALPVPENLAAAIEVQIDRLPASTRELLEAASVCGVEFHTSILAAVLGQDQRVLGDACEALTRQQTWLREIGFRELPNGVLDIRAGFRHALYRHVFYQRLGNAQRALYHRRVARALESDRSTVTPGELASHCELGHEYLLALRHYAAAAERAIQHFAPLEAVDITSHALLLLAKCEAEDAEIENETLEIELSLVAHRALACGQLFGVASPQAVAAFERAREICDLLPETPQRAVMLSGFGWMLFACGKYQETQALGQRVQKIAEAFDDRVLSICASNLLGMTFATRGDHSRACAWLQRGIDACSEMQDAIPTAVFLIDPEVAMRAVMSLPMTCLGLVEQARMQVNLAIARADRLGQPTARAMARRCAAQMEVRLHNPQRVAVIVEELEQIVAAHSLEQAKGPMWWLRGWLDAQRGDVQNGLQKMAAGFELHARSSMLGTCTEVFAYMAETCLLNGDIEQARRHMQKGLQLAEQIGEFFILPILLIVEGQIARAAGNHIDADTSLRKAVAVAQQQAAPLYEMEALLALFEFTDADTDREALAAAYRQLPDGTDASRYRQVATLLSK